MTHINTEPESHARASGRTTRIAMDMVVRGLADPGMVVLGYDHTSGFRRGHGLEANVRAILDALRIPATVSLTMDSASRWAVLLTVEPIV